MNKVKEEVNKYISQSYKELPFHNFWFLLNKPSIIELGGTCSDKVVYFKDFLFKRGIYANLHNAEINGKNIHRLLSLDISNDMFLIDVGLGWPILKVIPTFKETDFNAYGIFFKSSIVNERVILSRVKKNMEEISYSTSIRKCSQRKIRENISKRFEKKDKYPFVNSIRFSKVVNEEFYFLKGNKLQYTKNNLIYVKYLKYFSEYKFLFKHIFEFDHKFVYEAGRKFLTLEEE